MRKAAALALFALLLAGCEIDGECMVHDDWCDSYAPQSFDAAPAATPTQR